MDMTTARKRHKQVGEWTGGGQRAGKYKKEAAHPEKAETR